MKKYQLFVTIFWIALGLFISVYSYTKLNIGKLDSPGAGMMPFLLGIIFSGLAIYKLIASSMRNDVSEELPKETDKKPAEESKIHFNKPVLIVAALFAYALLLEPLGFIPTTFLTMTILFRSAGFKKWHIAAICSGIVVIITYFLFTYLGVRFPAGILSSIGTM
jgi:hypothetical protein